MILAVSRSKIDGGLEHAAAAAFAAQPSLVDSWPGFLGLETFSDTADATVFYWITRWTNREAFHGWQRSAAQRESHPWQGLRIDPSFTQLVQLERIPNRGSSDMATLAVDANVAVAAYLEQTCVVHVIRFGLNGDIQMVNAAMAAHLGSAESLRSRSIFEYLTEPDAATVRQWLSARSEPPNPATVNFCGPGGEPFTLSCRLTVYPDGCLIMGEAVYDDERRLQRQLMELNEELAALTRHRQRSLVSEQRARQLAEADNRDKDDGLAVIAHELRQPLNTALLALRVLKQTPALAERALPSLETQIGYMAKLVEDLLHVSQLMRGTITLERERADLAQVVQESAEFIEAAVLERGQQMTIDYIAAPLPVSVDIRRMRQVLANILSNAMKYTPAGGSIVVSLEQVGETACCVRVRDTGEGISADALGRVFDLFVRGTAGGNGLGIGLAVAKRLVELHGGSITATSEGLGRGSEFMVTLPLLTQTA